MFPKSDSSRIQRPQAFSSEALASIAVSLSWITTININQEKKLKKTQINRYSMLWIGKLMLLKCLYYPPKSTDSIQCTSEKYTFVKNQMEILDLKSRISKIQ